VKRPDWARLLEGKGMATRPSASGTWRHRNPAAAPAQHAEVLDDP
jgi:hypothetical protein